MRLIAINVGNSSITAALMDEHRVLEKIRAPVNDVSAIATLPDRLAVLRGTAQPPVAVASVNGPLVGELEAACSFPFLLAARDFPIPLVNHCREPQRTGHDRLLTTLAAGDLQGYPILVLDFGTALTFSLAGPDGAFLGGAIVPGLGLAARALGFGCVQLPQVDLTGTPPAVGQGTEEAIASGLLHGYVGLVDHMLATLISEAGWTCRPVATGGEVQLIASRLKEPVLIEPDLALRGISLACAVHLAGGRDAGGGGANR